MNLTLKEIQRYGTDLLRDIADMCERRQIPYYAIYGTLLGTVRHAGPIPWDYDIDLYVPENHLQQFIDAVKEDFDGKYWVDYRENTKTPRPFPRIGLFGYETDILHVDVFRMSGLPDRRIKQKLITFIGRKLFVIWKSKTLDLKFYYSDKKRQILAKCVQILTLPVTPKTTLKIIDLLCNKYEVMATGFVGRVMGRGAIYPTEYFKETLLLPYDDFQIRVPKEYDKLLTKMYGNYREYPPKEEQDKFYNMTYIVRNTKIES